MKIHTFKNLSAYYTKQGRIWHVLEGDEAHQFKSCEAMVEKFPGLMNVEAIANTIERRAYQQTAVVVEPDLEQDVMIQSKTVDCYYCSGSGEVFAGMPCPNCHGKGQVTVTTKGL